MGCPPAVRGMLQAVPGVESVDIDFASKTATCKVKGDLKPEILTDAVTGRFSATVKQ